ncbi:MAG: EamA family transporter RarD, partial [Verrucomicrobiaceae bacterium]
MSASSNQEPNTPRSQSSLGLLTAVLAFASWGLVPIYWKLLQTVSSMEILAHRLLWSFVFSALLLAFQRRWSEIGRSLRSRRQILMSVLSGAFICLNWYIFIWAVNSGHIVETSLGYFMTPLVNILLGALLFGERLRPVQWAAIGLAAVGVLNLTFGYGAFPWIGLSLCASFAVYGLLRKTSRADSLPGLFLESAAIMPLAVGYLVYLAHSGESAFELTVTRVPLLLMGGGVITALPLLWFAHAARNLKFSTLGLLQYLGPSISFLVGVFLYREPFTQQHFITFGCIWTALAIYTIESYFRGRRMVATADQESAEL